MIFALQGGANGSRYPEPYHFSAKKSEIPSFFLFVIIEDQGRAMIAYRVKQCCFNLASTHALKMSACAQAMSRICLIPQDGSPSEPLNKPSATLQEILKYPIFLGVSISTFFGTFGTVLLSRFSGFVIGDSKGGDSLA
ncbi:hypothetical protein [Rhizobium paknamense]|uniref:hypothetical protein n=1 Tax=Rhizobium paknamense TaxID=1206817 RepID=UPI0027D91FCF|nr:hypothetical protein [Rhizobium paknamense]